MYDQFIGSEGASLLTAVIRYTTMTRRYDDSQQKGEYVLVNFRSLKLGGSCLGKCGNFHIWALYRVAKRSVSFQFRLNLFYRSLTSTLPWVLPTKVLGCRLLQRTTVKAPPLARQIHDRECRLSSALLTSAYPFTRLQGHVF